MALHWQLENIKDWESYCFEEDKEEGGEKMTATTHCLIMASMVGGYDKITEKNHVDVYARLKIQERVRGAFRQRRGEKVYFTLEEVRGHIGLSTNASTLTQAQFLKNLYEAEKRDIVYYELEKEVA